MPRLEALGSCAAATRLLFEHCLSAALRGECRVCSRKRTSSSTCHASPQGRSLLLPLSCCCCCHLEDVVCISKLPRSPRPALGEHHLLLLLGCPMLLLCTALQRSCALLLGFVCRDGLEEAQHGCGGKAEISVSITSKSRTSEIMFIQRLAERNSEIFELLNLSALVKYRRYPHPWKKVPWTMDLSYALLT